jgi:hypothetical protein
MEGGRMLWRTSRGRRKWMSCYRMDAALNNIYVNTNVTRTKCLYLIQLPDSGAMKQIS